MQLSMYLWGDDVSGWAVPVASAISLAVGGLAWKLYEIWKGTKEQQRANLEEQQKLRQSDQSFIANQYRETIKNLVNNYQKDYEELQSRFNELRQAASEEAHELRDKLQRSLLSEAVYKERCSILEQQYKDRITILEQQVLETRKSNEVKAADAQKRARP